jgi:outer membrane protein OmpA-like peptidoglycan-associated protein
MKPLIATLLVAAAAAPAFADSPWDVAKGIAGSAATGKLEKEINTRLLAEARKNQCSFKSDTDQLEPGCERKASKLAQALIAAKKQLNAAGVKNYKFEVSGHTDTSGSAEHNKDLSAKRAAVMVKELVGAGVPGDEIVSVGMGSEHPLVKPDNTPAKKAKNRRYEVRVRL